MRLNWKSAPLRFIGGTVGAWVALRCAMVMLAELPPAAPVFPGTVRIAEVERPAPAMPAPAPAPLQAAAAAPAPAAGIPEWHGDPASLLLLASYRDVPTGVAQANYMRWSDPSALTRVAELSIPPDVVPVPAPRRVAGRWSGSAWVYLRQGSGPRSLAGGGQLGGSQAGGRLAYALSARTALAARGYAAIGQPGREVALGVEWQPIQSVRVAIERRVAADEAGRDAFAAYAAGGFWQEADGVVAEGYAQAGVVGVHSRDLFADGALRVGRQVGPVVVGAGAWGAAQPGAERIDVGPRVGMRLGDSPVSVAVERRFRVAGDASPGSGLALTLAADF